MNKYEEIGIAGEGAYGIVLKCKRRSSGEIVAIKQFKENDEEDEESARVIQREIKILGMLKHDHIVHMQETFRENGLLHIVCEYVDQCLLDVMDAHPGGVGVETTQRLMYQLTQVIAYCHQHGIIHRDIKPDNLLINSMDNSLKLCDFGSACIIDGQQVLTDYAATRWYRAPELLVRFNNYGPGVDMWGLGCVMGELIAGQPLFAGNTDVDQLFIIINALGPLTSEQTKRCFDLTGFVKFPEVGEHQTLAKRLGQKATTQQLHFLSRIFVVDPTERLTANTALSLPWLADGSAPAPPSFIAPTHSQSKQSFATPSQTTSGDPEFGIQTKPRIRKLIGVPGAAGMKEKPAVGIGAGVSAAAGVKEKPAVGIVAGASEVMRQSCQAESVSSFMPGSTMQQTSQFYPHDSCDISEEICDASILEDVPDGGSPGLIPAMSASATPGLIVQLGSDAVAARAGDDGGRPGGYGTRRDTEAPASVQLSPGSQESQVSGRASAGTNTLPFQMESIREHQSLPMHQQTKEHKTQGTTSCMSTQNTCAMPKQNWLPSNHPDPLDESIMEDLSNEQLASDYVVDTPEAKPVVLPQLGGTGASRLSSKPSLQGQHIRAVSSSSRGSGNSAPKSSLTPMS